MDDVDPMADSAWAQTWRTAGAAAAAAIDRLLAEEAAAGQLTGPLIAREVAAATGPGDVLFAGSSNPIRDLDLAARPFDPTALVLANRGLAGIDGTLSTASGVALSNEARNSAPCNSAPSNSAPSNSAPSSPRTENDPNAASIDARLVGDSQSVATGQVRCLVGDLTFLHDVGGLLVGPLEERPNLQIIVVDDGGGGIFSLLEHGARANLGDRQRALFERVFGTPPGADLGALCVGYGVEHQIVDDVTGLRKALADPPRGTSVIQVRVDRSAHRTIADRLRGVVREVLAGSDPGNGLNPASTSTASSQQRLKHTCR